MFVVEYFVKAIMFIKDEILAIDFPQFPYNNSKFKTAKLNFQIKHLREKPSTLFAWP